MRVERFRNEMLEADAAGVGECLRAPEHVVGEQEVVSSHAFRGSSGLGSARGPEGATDVLP